MRDGKIGQISETTNKLTIEMSGFFTDLQEIEKKFQDKNFLKEDIYVILTDYDNQVVPLKTLEQMREKVKQLTANITPRDDELTRFVKTVLSVRKNIQFTGKKQANFIQGLLDGKCNSTGLATILDLALELQQVQSNIVVSNKQVQNEVNLGGRWYNFNVLSSKTNLAQNIGKYLKKEKDSKSRHSIKKVQDRMKSIAKRYKSSIPEVEFGKRGLFKTVKSFFTGKKKEDLALPEPAPVKQQAPHMKLVDYSPAGMIGEDILWEMKTWDNTNVQNRVQTGYVLLPKVGTPEQIYNSHPEMFTKIYNSLSQTAQGQKVPFLGKIFVGEQENEWTAFSNVSPEMQRISQPTFELIRNKMQTNQIVAEFERTLKNLTIAPPPQVAEEVPPKPQIDLQQANNTLPVTKQLHSVNTNVEEKETIVISDLHSNMNRWNIVKEKLGSNPNLNVIILGDAMDRGTYGVEILLQIKELSDIGRVKYLPGNHDEFAYNCIRGELEGMKDEEVYTVGKAELLNNRGSETYQKLTNFQKTVEDAMDQGYIRNPISIYQLLDWLGKQPLQMTLQQDNNMYAIAHAFFDSKLYAYDKNFNLQKAFDMQKSGKNMKNSEVLRRAKNALWYRVGEKDTNFAPISWPQRYAMVVGHSSQEKGVNIKLFEDDYMKPMVYVDCGKYKSLGAFNLKGKVIPDLQNWTIEKNQGISQSYSRE